MPLRDRASYMKSYRAARRAVPVPLPAPVTPSDPVSALAEWARTTLKVPPGHPLSGEPMTLPPFAEAFLRDALTHRESLLSTGRKQAKSAIVGVYVLGRLVGPLRTDGYRCGIVSVSREKASELWMQMQAIAEASGLHGLTFTKVPRRIVGPSGTVDILSADASAGHASSFDDAIVDELGLLAERDRGLVNGMMSSISAKDGRFIALSIQGQAPFTREMIERRDDPAVAVHLYAPPADAAVDDEAAWHAGNPGLGTIKSLSAMRDASRRALGSTANVSDFKAHEMNLPQSPSVEMIVDLSDWKACVVAPDDLPPRAGECCIGLDAGGSSSMTCIVALWPRTGRVEAWGAFGDIPTLEQRGQADNINYVDMERRGELTAYTGWRTTPVSRFVQDVAARLDGANIAAVGADRYRSANVLDGLAMAGVEWPIVWRGSGASPVADGTHDVTAFQRLVLSRTLRVRESLLLASAISDSSLRYDGAGNAALDKSRSRGRIDALSAAVIACGLGSRIIARPQREPQGSVIV